MLVALVAVIVLGGGPIGRARNYVTTWMAMDVGAPSGGEPFDLPSAGARPEVRLAAVGDVGTGDRKERSTADAINAIPGRYDGLVLLGDNVYPSGDPDRIANTVFRPFRETLEEGTDLLAVLGNHDVMDGNGPGQVAALDMPGRWYAWHRGPVLLIVLDSTRPDDPQQLAWLERTLATATEPWRIVALHHPPYSAGWHGSSINVRHAFEPLFERFGVELVLAGHDHDYQRSKPIHGVTYIVSGAGATARPTSRASFTAESWSTQHFIDLEVWCDHLLVQAVGQDGLVYDHATLEPAAAASSAC
jgi:3',5'-cyclic AMP phosphodiesterase CpdA